MMRRAIWLSLLFIGFVNVSGAQSISSKEIMLWQNTAPGSEGKTGMESVRVTEQGDHVITGVNRPSITPYFPSAANSTGIAVIIAPGGGHSELWITHEG